MAATADQDKNMGELEMWERTCEKLWGPHLHNGFFDPNRPCTGVRASQMRLIEEGLCFAGFSDDPKTWPKNVVDVGCGLGASSRYMARKYGAKCHGFTISQSQVQKANALAVAEGLADKVSFQVADALEQPFPDGQFDLVWSLESAECMPDKRKFLSELARVAAPRATIVIMTWCQRDLSPSEESLQTAERELLKKITDTFQTREFYTAADYVQSLQSLSLQDIKVADWSQYVAPFPRVAIRSLLTWRGLKLLLCSSLKTIRMLMIPLLFKDKKDLLEYTIITCRKPE